MCINLAVLEIDKPCRLLRNKERQPLEHALGSDAMSSYFLYHREDDEVESVGACKVCTIYN